MGFGDKFKDLAKQAQDVVAERKEQITGAVDRASAAADERTGGKYADKIAKVSQKAGEVVEKLSGDENAAATDPPAATNPAAATDPPAPAEPPVPDPKPPAGTSEFPDFR